MEDAPDFSPAPPAEASSSALVPVEAPEAAEPPEPEIQLAPDDQALLQDVQARAVEDAKASGGYTAMMCAAIIEMLGEGVALPRELRDSPKPVWCTGCCVGCGRELSLFVAPGLDVVQCVYCGATMFTGAEYVSTDAVPELPAADPLIVRVPAFPAAAAAPPVDSIAAAAAVVPRVRTFVGDGGGGALAPAAAAHAADHAARAGQTRPRDDDADASAGARPLKLRLVANGGSWHLAGRDNSPQYGYGDSDSDEDSDDDDNDGYYHHGVPGYGRGRGRGRGRGPGRPRGSGGGRGSGRGRGRPPGRGRGPGAGRGRGAPGYPKMRSGRYEGVAARYGYDAAYRESGEPSRGALAYGRAEPMPHVPNQGSKCAKPRWRAAHSSQK